MAKNSFNNTVRATFLMPMLATGLTATAPAAFVMMNTTPAMACDQNGVSGGEGGVGGGRPGGCVIPGDNKPGTPDKTTVPNDACLATGTLIGNIWYWHYTQEHRVPAKDKWYQVPQNVTWQDQHPPVTTDISDQVAQAKGWPLASENNSGFAAMANGSTTLYIFGSQHDHLELLQSQLGKYLENNCKGPKNRIHETERKYGTPVTHPKPKG